MSSLPVIECGFPFGRTVVTVAARELLDHENLVAILNRHGAGDWGDLGDDDKLANEVALARGARILSRYDLPAGSFYVITEWDRSGTTIMRVEDY